MLWDQTNGAKVAGGSVTASGNDLIAKFPVKFLEDNKVTFPAAFYVESSFGEGLAGPVQADDRAPDAGTVQYG